MSIKRIALFTVPVFAVPFVVFARDLGGVDDLVRGLGNVVNLLLPIVVSIALLFFFWGLAVYILNAGNEEKKKEGRSIMWWGVIALFVMVSVWGIVNFIGGALGIERGTNISVPTVPGNGSSGPSE